MPRRALTLNGIIASVQDDRWQRSLNFIARILPAGRLDEAKRGLQMIAACCQELVEAIEALQLRQREEQEPQATQPPAPQPEPASP